MGVQLENILKLIISDLKIFCCFSVKYLLDLIKNFFKNTIFEKIYLKTTRINNEKTSTFLILFIFNNQKISQIFLTNFILKSEKNCGFHK